MSHISRRYFAKKINKYCSETVETELKQQLLQQSHNSGTTVETVMHNS